MIDDSRYLSVVESNISKTQVGRPVNWMGMEVEAPREARETLVRWKGFADRENRVDLWMEDQVSAGGPETFLGNLDDSHRLGVTTRTYGETDKGTPVAPGATYQTDIWELTCLWVNVCALWLTFLPFFYSTICKTMTAQCGVLLHLSNKNPARICLNRK